MAKPGLQIERFREGDEDAVYALLRSAGLPVEGLAPHLGSAFVARRGNVVVGTVALEVYPDGGLLRSLAVSDAEQGGGVGRMLTEAVLGLARAEGVVRVFLLTETAADYFPRFGFRDTTRAAVPAGVGSSLEFTTLCPVGAAVLVLELE